MNLLHFMLMFTINLDFDSPVEYEGKMPIELFIRGMFSNTGVFLSESFKAQAQSFNAPLVGDLLIDDLEKGKPILASDLLKYYYLLMDFKEDFPRYMLLDRRAITAPSSSGS